MLNKINKPIFKKKKMKQPIKGHKNKTVKTNNRQVGVGTSKLEKYFAEQFLDKLKLKYIYQFKANDIQRYFDFGIILNDKIELKYELVEGVSSIVQTNNIQHYISFLIEVDGDYYHANPQKVDSKRLNKMQKHNKRIDEHKNQWSKMHNIPLLRIWEEDIRNNGTKVLNEIKRMITNIEKHKLLY